MSRGLTASPLLCCCCRCAVGLRSLLWECVLLLVPLVILVVAVALAQRALRQHGAAAPGA